MARFCTCKLDLYGLCGIPLVLFPQTILCCFIQEIVTLDVKEIAFKVLQQLPDVTILSRGDFLVSWNGREISRIT